MLWLPKYTLGKYSLYAGIAINFSYCRFLLPQNALVSLTRKCFQYAARRKRIFFFSPPPPSYFSKIFLFEVKAPILQGVFVKNGSLKLRSHSMIWSLASWNGQKIVLILWDGVSWTSCIHNRMKMKSISYWVSLYSYLVLSYLIF